MPIVSIFRNVADPNNPEHLDLLEYLEFTRDGKWEDIVLKCRTLETKEERKKFKATMPTTTLSGKFRYRNDKDMLEHSGIIAMDIDDIQNLEHTKSILKKDRHVFSVFVSTSGYGLRALFKIEPERHKDAFRGISDYLFRNYRIVCDPNGINVSKPYIVSYDPFLYINPDYDELPVFKKYIKEKPIKNLPDFVHTSSDFDSVLKEITGRRINICEDYNDWLRVCFAISEQFGEDGRRYFHEISSISDKYDPKITDNQYKYCLKAKGSGIKISTFYYLAKSHGVKIATEQTKEIVRTTRNGKKAGLTKEQIVKNLEKFSSITGADEVVNQVYDSQEYEDNEEQSSIYQLEMFISSNYSLRMNEVTGYLEQNGQRLSASDLNSMFISAKKLIPKLDYQLMMRLLKSDFIETYNPFFEFFNSDGIAVHLPPLPEEEKEFTSPLIDKLAQSIKNENPAYTVYFLRKWLVGIVSAAHKVHSPLLLCLLGVQNTGKTEFFRRLLPKELQEYYAESKLDKEKDDEILMTENILIVDDELGGKSKQDSQKLKNITSKQYFSLRRPYGDHNEKILRLAVLGGTSNFREVLNDPTGNRRIIPIEVDDIDKELYNSVDKRELFLECFRLYKEGFDWRVNSRDIKYLNKDDFKYESTVKERELLEKYFYPEEGDVKLTTTEILVEIEKLTNQKLSINVLGRELHKLGYTNKSSRVNAFSCVRKWCVKRIGRSESSSGDVPF